MSGRTVPLGFSKVTVVGSAVAVAVVVSVETVPLYLVVTKLTAAYSVVPTVAVFVASATAAGESVLLQLSPVPEL